MKRLLKIAIGLFVLVLIVAGVAALVLVRTAGRRGSGAVEGWVGRQLQGVAGNYLNPTLTLGDLDYQYPKTVVLNGCRLTADDPQGGTIDILAARRIELVMAEVPRAGEPVRIERLALAAPELRLVALGPEDARLIGFSNLLKQPGAPKSDPEAPVRLSDVFQIRWIEIADGRVQLDLRRPQQSPMVLDGMNAQLAVDPEDTGWYRIDTKVVREPAFDLDLKGTLNLDEVVLDLAGTVLAMKLGGEQNRYLPPQLQKMLADHDVQGDLTLHLDGRLPATDWRTAALRARLELDDGHVAVGARRLPVQRLEADLALADRVARIERFTARTLGGSLTARGTIGLDGAMDAQIDVDADGLRIEQTLRTFSEDARARPPYEGRAGGRVSFRGPVTQMTTRAGGEGELHVRAGRLGQTPLLTAITAATRAAGKAADLDLSATGDEADLAFDLAGDHLHFTQITVRGASFSLRGEGRMYFDQRLDLRFNGGPLEKVQDKLGDIGRLLAKVTDALLKYTVRGTVEEPEVGVALGPGG